MLRQAHLIFTGPLAHETSSHVISKLHIASVMPARNAQISSSNRLSGAQPSTEDFCGYGCTKEYSDCFWPLAGSPIFDLLNKVCWNGYCDKIMDFEAL